MSGPGVDFGKLESLLQRVYADGGTVAAQGTSPGDEKNLIRVL